MLVVVVVAATRFRVIPPVAVVPVAVVAVMVEEGLQTLAAVAAVVEPTLVQELVAAVELE
jgi:hypothetical protein